MSDHIQCPLCGMRFGEADSAAPCGNFCGKSTGCTFCGGSRMIRCPNCGYKMPPEPAWIKKIKKENKKR